MKVSAHCPAYLKPADAGFFGSGDSRDHSLVRGSKSQTPIKPAVNGAPGVYGVIEYRDWCDEYRIRTECDAGGSPPLPDGARVNDALTERAAMKIAEAGRYVALKKGGFQTFLTLTFDDVSRAALNREITPNCRCEGPWMDYPRRRDGRINEKPSKDAMPRATIQRHVSRFFDGLRKMHGRGWVTSKGRRVPASGAELLYIWVAENPENANGDRNPHVHVLLNWKVPYFLFVDWAARIESLWGQGFAHLEKIREEKAATGYLLKALGYMAKGAGSGSDQGPIRGNRYAISQGAQAPAWVTIEKRELRALGVLIADIDNHVSTLYAQRDAEYIAAKNRREAVAGANARLKADGKEVSKDRQRMYERARNLLEKGRREKSERPIVSSKYHLIIRGSEAYCEVRSFLGADHDWPSGVVEWLPEKPAAQFWETTQKPPSADVVKMKAAIQWRVQEREAKKRCWTDPDFAFFKPLYIEMESYLLAKEAENGGDDSWHDYY